MFANEEPRSLDEEEQSDDADLTCETRSFTSVVDTHAARDELQGKRQPPLDCSLLGLQDTAR